MKRDKYYVLKSFIANAPLLSVDEDIDVRCIHFLSKSMTVADDYVAYLSFMPPIPRKPQMADLLILNGGRCVFSKKIYDILCAKPIKGLQLVPVVISDNKKNKIENYFVANVYQKYSFFDNHKSKYGRISKLTGDWDNVKKIVLSEEEIVKVPLEDRFAFVAQENSSFILFHESIIDTIMSVNPEGITPIDIEKWNEDIRFQ